MKKKYFLILVLIFVPSVLGETFTDVRFETGDVQTLSGVRIVLENIGDEKYVFSVNGYTGITEKEGIINKVKFEIKQEFPEFIDANITFNFKCGDNNCSDRENPVVCCLDCGCAKGYICVEGGCTKKVCVIDSDCDDGSPCTIDYCSTEKLCYYDDLKQCINNDSCCPASCTNSTDNDCKPIQENITINNNSTISANNTNDNISLTSVTNDMTSVISETAANIRSPNQAHLEDENKEGIIKKLVIANTIILLMIFSYFIILPRMRRR